MQLFLFKELKEELKSTFYIASIELDSTCSMEPKSSVLGVAKASRYMVLARLMD